LSVRDAALARHATLVRFTQIRKSRLSGRTAADLLVPTDAVPHTLGRGFALLGSFNWWSAAGALLSRMWAGYWSWIALVATWTLLNTVWLSLLTITQVR